MKNSSLFATSVKLRAIKSSDFWTKSEQSCGGGLVVTVVTVVTVVIVVIMVTRWLLGGYCGYCCGYCGYCGY